jgi:NADH-ubiquinone oxidoreductase chain 2
MIFLSLLILIGQIALSSVKNNQSNTSPVFTSLSDKDQTGGLSPILFSRVTAIIFLYTGALIINAFYIQSIGSGIGIFGGLFYVTSITQLFELFFLFIAFLILPCFSPLLPILKSFPTGSNVKIYGVLNPKGGDRSKEYSLIALFSSLGSILLLSSFDLISMYLSIELQSFGLYILSIVYLQNKESTNASLKYFLLGGLSSCIILLGSAIIYSFLGVTNLESIYILLSSTSNLSDSYLQTYERIGGVGGLNLGLILIIIGLLFKLAAAPLHNWAPDVYAESPTKVTIWLTILPKISILCILLEILSHIPLSTSNYMGLELQIKNLLLISSLFSLLIGTVVGLSQIKIKRLLAYSTISHIGFILLALAINSQSSIESLIFYIIQYSITNMNTFLIIIALSYIIYPTFVYLCPESRSGQGKDAKSETDINLISELKSQFFLNPLLSLSLIICLFSMAGIPPFIGFFSKQFVLFSAIDTGYYYISFIAIITSVISAYYYLNLIISIASTNPSPTSALSRTQVEARIFENITVAQATNMTENCANQSPINTEVNIEVNTKVNTTEGEQNEKTIINYYHSYIISTFTFIIVFFIIKSSIILNISRVLSLTIYYT